MTLDEVEARARLATHVHGVLCTIRAGRGPDAVPCVYAVTDGGHLGVPVDAVQPQAGARLQRERNLAADPRHAGPPDPDRVRLCSGHTRWYGLPRPHHMSADAAGLLGER